MSGGRRPPGARVVMRARLHQMRLSGRMLQLLYFALQGGLNVLLAQRAGGPRRSLSPVRQRRRQPLVRVAERAPAALQGGVLALQKTLRVPVGRRRLLHAAGLRVRDDGRAGREDAVVVGRRGRHSVRERAFDSYSVPQAAPQRARAARMQRRAPEIRLALLFIGQKRLTDAVATNSGAFIGHSRFNTQLPIPLRSSENKHRGIRSDRAQWATLLRRYPSLPLI